jgi:hypothetical protein
MGEINGTSGGVPCGFPGEVGSLGLAMTLKAAADGSRVIEFTRAGVVQLPGYDLSFAVNGESIEEYIRSEVEKRRPAKDQYGNFAGKVTIRIEFLGDMMDGGEPDD